MITITKPLYDWDALYERADGKGFGDPELSAKDDARYWFEIFLHEEHVDLNECDCPEDVIDEWLNDIDYVPLFDESGSWVCNIDKGRLWTVVGFTAYKEVAR